MPKTTVDIEDNLFEELQNWCKENGPSMKWVIENGIKKVIRNESTTQKN